MASYKSEIKLQSPNTLNDLLPKKETIVAETKIITSKKKYLPRFCILPKKNHDPVKPKNWSLTTGDKLLVTNDINHINYNEFPTDQLISSKSNHPESWNLAMPNQLDNGQAERQGGRESGKTDKEPIVGGERRWSSIIKLT